MKKLHELDIYKTHTQPSKTKINLKINSLFQNLLTKNNYWPEWPHWEFYKIFQKETPPIFHTFFQRREKKRLLFNSFF